MTHGMMHWSPSSGPLRSRLNRMIEDAFGEFDPARRSEAVSSRGWAPLVDIRETGEALAIEIDLPGIAKEDVQITLENSVLTIAGERRWTGDDNRESYHRIEREYGPFTRSFTLPRNVSGDQVNASFDSGVLRVTLPKREESKPRKISIE